MGSQIFPVPVGLTTAVLCANLLSPQVLEGLSEGLSQGQGGLSQVLEGYWEVYQKVTVRLLEDLILNNYCY